MEHDLSIHDLMVRLKARDEAAAREVFQRYAEQLIELARHKLRPIVRSKVDPEDVLQSALRSFFVRQQAGEFAGVDTWESLWKVLVTLTLRKCGRRLGHFLTDRRNIRLEVSETPAADESQDHSWEALLAAPTEVEAIQLTETLEILLNRLGKEDRRGERNRQILALHLQGHDAVAISEKLNCTERTVYRILERVKEILNRMQAEDN